MKLCWIWVRPQSNYWDPCMKGKRTNPHGDRGRDWSNAATAKDAKHHQPRPEARREAWHDFSLEPLRQQADTLVSNFSPSVSWENTLLLFYSRWFCVMGAPGSYHTLLLSPWVVSAEPWKREVLLTSSLFKRPSSLMENSCYFSWCCIPHLFLLKVFYAHNQRCTIHKHVIVSVVWTKL